MTIFWCNKDGKFAPPNAKFQLIPFSGKTRTVFSDVVHQLPEPQKLRLKSRTDSPNRSDWNVAVQKALSSPLDKVVLARETTLVFHDSIDPFRLAAALQPKTRGAALFCANTGPKAFVGLSPERLFLRNGHTVITEAVAGTKPLGIAHSEKDAREHAFVQQYLENVLSPFCSSLQFSPTRVHATATVQHLFSEGIGHLHTPDDEPLLQALHPTPAVCGTPKIQAQDYLKQTEPFARGWYAGVIGWSTPEASEWAVGIRSCVVERNVVRLYAGAGIVQGSDPDAEWDELEAKIALYGDVCGL